MVAKLPTSYVMIRHCKAAVLLAVWVGLSAVTTGVEAAATKRWRHNNNWGNNANWKVPPSGWDDVMLPGVSTPTDVLLDTAARVKTLGFSPRGTLLFSGRCDCGTSKQSHSKCSSQSVQRNLFVTSRCPATLWFPACPQAVCATLWVPGLSPSSLRPLARPSTHLPTHHHPSTPSAHTTHTLAPLPICLIHSYTYTQTHAYPNANSPTYAPHTPHDASGQYC